MPEIEICKADNQSKLLLSYTPENGIEWIDKKLKDEGKVSIKKKIFNFEIRHLLETEDSEDEGKILVSTGERVQIFGGFDGERIFLLGQIDGEYYRIKANILGLKHDLLLYKDMAINAKTFITSRNISIFKKIDLLVEEQIIIGGTALVAIPVEEFEKLLKDFPNTGELDKYANGRISRILKDYFETMPDAQQKFEEYLKKKKPEVWVQSKSNNMLEYESKKFESIRDELREMLSKVEEYREIDWQNKIVELLLLLFPKYIAILKEVKIKDFCSTPSKPKDRFIDLTLVDANGYLDIIEIKKPGTNLISIKPRYRDNYIPRSELSGTIMQVEKYLFHLSKWGKDGESKINDQFKGLLPVTLKITIANPKAMIILGRDNDFNKEQKFDFEIIKRKYANVMDIITYDDLLRRLDNIIAMIEKRRERCHER